jgi:hypothetical protein
MLCVGGSIACLPCKPVSTIFCCSLTVGLIDSTLFRKSLYNLSYLIIAELDETLDKYWIKNLDFIGYGLEKINYLQ